MTTVLERLEEELATSDVENIRTHIINPPANMHIWSEGMEIQEVVNIARNFGWPVKTLCELVFVPKRDPDAYPACEDCIRIAGELMSGAGE